MATKQEKQKLTQTEPTITGTNNNNHNNNNSNSSTPTIPYHTGNSNTNSNHVSDRSISPPSLRDSLTVSIFYLSLYSTKTHPLIYISAVGILCYFSARLYL